MPRFSVGILRRKTAQDDSPAIVPSFRVLERPSAVRNSTYGGQPVPRKPIPIQTGQFGSELDNDNMFAGMKTTEYSSGSSNITQTPSTDTSSRHSNMSSSTAPSSAELGTAVEDLNTAPKRAVLADIAVPANHRSATSKIFHRASQTFAFGNLKKSSSASPLDFSTTAINTDFDLDDNLTPVPLSLKSTTPRRLDEGDSNPNFGADPGKMNASLNKRASMSNFHDEAGRLLLSFKRTSRVIASHNTPPERLAPRSRNPFSSNTTLPRPDNIAEHDDHTLLMDTVAASKLLSIPSTTSRGDDMDQELYPLADLYPVQYGYGPRAGEGNVFAETSVTPSRIAHLSIPSRPYSSPRTKVMTPAQFEKYRQDKERQGTLRSSDQEAPDNEDDDNYEEDGDEDSTERTQEAARQRQRQETHMTAYRQQMRKMTGEAGIRPMSGIHPYGLHPSKSTPNLMGKSPSPDMTRTADSPEGDEDIPLAILQAHGFSNKAGGGRTTGRPSSTMLNLGLPKRLSGPGQDNGTGNNGNNGLSAVNKSHAASRMSLLPAFARNLPQDPFVTPGLGRQAGRDSVFIPEDTGIASASMPAQQPTQLLSTPGGLVGVIMQEERARALRRGSQVPDYRKFPFAAASTSSPFDAAPVGYGYGMNPRASVSQLTMSPADTARLSVDQQQMNQMMQLQMHLMQQMMTTQQQDIPSESQPSVMRQSMSDMSFRNSMTLDAAALDASMQRMSMIQPGSTPWVQQRHGPTQPVRAPQGAGYAPSLAPSERSNVGLPSRYRPVSQHVELPALVADIPEAGQSVMESMRQSSTMPVGVRPNSYKAAAAQDDDDEEAGWVAMTVKRDLRKSMWRAKHATSVMGLA